MLSDRARCGIASATIFGVYLPLTADDFFGDFLFVDVVNSLDFLSTESRPSFRRGIFSGTIFAVDLRLAADIFLRNFFLFA